MCRKLLFKELTHHLLPLSEILFDLEKKMGAELQVAEGMVIIKDQITVMKLTSQR